MFPKSAQAATRKTHTQSPTPRATPPRCAAATPQAFAALPPGGAFVALDLLIDDARRANRWGLYQSLSMLTEFDRECAFDYSYADFRGWAAAAGFGRTEMIDLGGPASAAVAYKDA